MTTTSPSLTLRVTALGSLEISSIFGGTLGFLLIFLVLRFPLAFIGAAIVVAGMIEIRTSREKSD